VHSVEEEILSAGKTTAKTLCFRHPYWLWLMVGAKVSHELEHMAHDDRMMQARIQAILSAWNCIVYCILMNESHLRYSGLTDGYGWLVEPTLSPLNTSH
jgi:hypothetical protein